MDKNNTRSLNDDKHFMELQMTNGLINNSNSVPKGKDNNL